jgi:tRNA 2-thiouridine synthesizing protein A
MAVTFNQTGAGQWKLDVRGYSCPHPQMYTKKAMQKLASGDTLHLVFDNPSSGESILAMCDPRATTSSSAATAAVSSSGRSARAERALKN